GDAETRPQLTLPPALLQHLGERPRALRLRGRLGAEIDAENVLALAVDARRDDGVAHRGERRSAPATEVRRPRALGRLCREPERQEPEREAIGQLPPQQDEDAEDGRQREERRA